MNCLYRMYVLILHHKLFMFNLIISVRIQTDHIQSSAYSPLRPLSINKPLQPAERLSKKWLLDQDFWEISNMKCLFFRFGWLFYFRQNNRDKYPCRRGYCVMTVQWFYSTWRKVADKITWKLMGCIITHIIFVNDPPNPDSRPYVDVYAIRYHAISELPAITKCMHDDLMTSTRWLCLINPEKKLCYSLLLKRQVFL